MGPSSMGSRGRDVAAANDDPHFRRTPVLTGETTTKCGVRARAIRGRNEIERPRLTRGCDARSHRPPAVATTRGACSLHANAASQHSRRAAASGDAVLSTLEILVLFGAGTAAGAINSLAGGGTLVSFPALLWLGRAPIVANATNTVALCPGALAAMFAFRNDLAPIRRWMLLIVPPSLAGGLLGALLLLRTPERVFAALVPWLILFATVLFAAQGPLVATVRRFRPARVDSAPRDEPRAEAWPWIVAFEFAVAIYGGYFGAGIGIMTLAVLGLVGFTDIHHMVGLRNFAALCINGIASIYFVSQGAVVWPDALVMIVGQVVGGYGGARIAQRLGRTFMRRAVVVIGIVMALSLFFAR